MGSVAALMICGKRRLVLAFTNQPRGDSCPRLSSRAKLDRALAESEARSLSPPDSRGGCPHTVRGDLLVNDWSAM